MMRLSFQPFLNQRDQLGTLRISDPQDLVARETQAENAWWDRLRELVEQDWENIQQDLEKDVQASDRDEKGWGAQWFVCVGDEQ